MTQTSNRYPHHLALPLAATLALAACAPEPIPSEPKPKAEPESADEANTTNEPEGVSILRPEIEPPEADPTPEALPRYQAIVTFPDGGNDLDDAAIRALTNALASPQMDLGLPVTLSAHSDSAGSDDVNLDASEKRGLAVAQWLIDNGVAADRITVIAFGEQNPIEPNANADGSPNEAGRAANRRVEIEIAVTKPSDNPSKNDQTDPDLSVEARD